MKKILFQIISVIGYVAAAISLLLVIVGFTSGKGYGGEFIVPTIVLFFVGMQMWLYSSGEKGKANSRATSNGNLPKTK